ncbi:MAG: tRNA lysidine(34) synthetase TilS [bacterium]
MTFKEDIKEKVRSFIEQKKLLKRGDRILLGVSGGQDSTCMLDLLNQLKDEIGFKMSICYINHLLRKDSIKDELFVRSLSDRYGLEVFIERIDVNSFAKEQRLNVEEAGRIIRYKTLRKIAVKKRFNKIALGHTASDQIEWFFLALMRGSGGGGLSSLRERGTYGDVLVIRPILCLFRDDALRYLNESGLEYIIDETNYNQRFDRNYIRENIVQLIDNRFTKSGLENILRSISLLHEDDVFITDIAKEFIKKYSDKKLYGHIFNADELKKINIAVLSRVIRICSKHYDKIYPPTMENTIRACSMILSNKSGKVSPLVNDIICEISEGKVRIGKVINKVKFSYSINYIPETLYIKEINKKIRIERSIIKKDKDKNFNFIMRSKNIILPLRLRNIMPGDRINPSGMKGTKKISDILIDMKVPVWEKRLAIVIDDKTDILGVYPYKLSERASLRDENKGIIIREVE